MLAPNVCSKLSGKVDQMIRSAGYAEKLTEILRQEILNGQHDSGTIIDEVALAQRHKISRTPVREALKMLAKEGLVETVPRKGCRVRKLTFDEALELYPIIAILESYSIAETCYRITDAQIRQLQSIHKKMEAACTEGDIDSYYLLNMKIHKLLSQFSSNNYLSNLIEQLNSLMFLTRHRQLLAKGRVLQSLREHRLLMTALEDRNPAMASRVMKEHVLNNWRAFLDVARTAEDKEASIPEHPYLHCEGEWPDEAQLELAPISTGHLRLTK